VTPIIDQQTLDFISHSAEQTQRMGARLSQLFTGGEVLFLTGDLGTGKTCLTQGIGQGLGIEERITSPTFTLVNEYKGKHLALYHVDLYRIVDVKATLNFGMDEYLYGDGVCAIEWAERVKPIWTEEYLLISLRYIDEMKRGIALRGVGHRYDRMVKRFKCEAFGVR
jgi:tRNA threonylcarbamoyladenosine biosynthesis protein TsaE